VRVFAVGQVLLTAQPGPGLQQRPASSAPFWRRYVGALQRVPGTRFPLAQLLGTAAVAQLLGLALPVMVWLVIDKIIPARAGSVIWVLGLSVAQLHRPYARTAA